MLGATVSGYAGARTTLVGGGDATVKVLEDLTAKLAADTSLFLGPKLEAAGTVGKVSAVKSLVDASRNHTYGDAATVGASSQSVAAQQVDASGDDVHTTGSRTEVAGSVNRAAGEQIESVGSSVLSAGDVANVAGSVSLVSGVVNIV
ncbi:MAG: hypothetical protein LBP38_01550 [Desulfovibrio sp.]|nr:hypothetical protein [Desulfovibrio sp.]